MVGKRVLIIGAGVGGLSAGCYAQMNGYETLILEMHTAPGGVCTSWRRGGYVFDGCIHNLAGTNDASDFNAMWCELGVIPTLKMHAYPEMVALERPDGKPFIVYSDLNRLEAHMRELFPRDVAEIEHLIAAARRLGDLDILALDSVGDRVRAAAKLPGLMSIGALTLEQYARRFKDPFLRQAFPRIVYDWPKQTMFMLLHFLARMDKGDMGWPIGGSGALAGAIERRFKALGGTIRYQTPVGSIIVENDRAVGVRLADGSEERADIVISNTYGPSTIFGMLGGRYATRALRAHYGRPEDRVEMGLHVSLGVARDLSAEPHAIVLPLAEPTMIDGELRDRLYVQTFGYDPSMAPPGKGVLKALQATNWSRWEALAESPQRYKAEQARIGEAVVKLLEARFPGIGKQVEVIDVATPITTKRVTGNGVGFRLNAGELMAGMLFGKRWSQTLPGLANFYMVGQWAGMPGVPMVAAMGRDIVRAICRRDGVSFSTLLHRIEITAAAWRGAA